MRQNTHEMICIKKAYKELLKLQLESKERHHCQSTLALLRNMIAEHHNVDPERIQAMFEEWILFNSEI